FHRRSDSQRRRAIFRGRADDRAGVVNRQGRPQPELLLIQSETMADERKNRSAEEIKIKTAPSETDISSSLAPTTGPTAAIALPPQIAVPTEINSAGVRSTFSHRPSATPRIIVAAMPSAV